MTIDKKTFGEYFKDREHIERPKQFICPRCHRIYGSYQILPLCTSCQPSQREDELNDSNNKLRMEIINKGQELLRATSSIRRHQQDAKQQSEIINQLEDKVKNDPRR